MKKVISTLMLFVLVVSCFSVQARDISEKEAKSAAAYYMSVYSSIPDVKADDLVLIHQIINPDLDVPACFFFNVSDWGWIIMAGSSAVDPVVAFSDRCGNMDMNNVPDNMMAWVNDYSGMIMAIQNADRKNQFPDVEEWQNLLKQKSVDTPKGGEHYLMDEAWDQGQPNGHLYNSMCPQINGYYCYVGCVATALSQIIHYYKYPVQPFGYHRYDWNGTVLRFDYDNTQFNYSLMPNRLTENSSAAKKAEVAKLCYAVGVAMDMSYGIDGSGAYSANVPNNMATYFKYNVCTQVHRENQGRDTAFCGKIRRELMLNRPVYMSGASSTNNEGSDASGHAWICCGYRDDQPNMYWINWGWGGTDDGWYNLVTNDQTSMYLSNTHYTFNLRQSCMIGFIPPHADSSAVDFMPHTEGIAPVSTTQLKPAYPNPASYSVSLPYSTTTTDVLTVYSVDGRPVISQNVQAGDGVVTINIDKMPAGIYIYRLGGASGKFIVQ